MRYKYMWVTARWPIIATSSLHHDDDARCRGVETKYEMENGGGGAQRR